MILQGSAMFGPNPDQQQRVARGSRAIAVEAGPGGHSVGIFFRTPGLRPVVRAAIEDTIGASTQMGGLAPREIIAKVDAKVDRVVEQASSSLIVGRLVVAIILLVAIAAFGVYATVNKLDPWATLLPHSFELVLGLLIGLLGGEAASQHQ
jgi:hypothetical protein